MLALQGRKQELAATLWGDGDASAGLGAMTEDDVKLLFAPPFRT